jgi:hypothetical protein
MKKKKQVIQLDDLNLIIKSFNINKANKIHC